MVFFPSTSCSMEIQGETLTGAPQLSFVGWESSHTARGSCSIMKPDYQASKHGCAMCQLSRWSALRSVVRTKECLHEQPRTAQELSPGWKQHRELMSSGAEVTPLSCSTLSPRVIFRTTWLRNSLICPVKMYFAASGSRL